MDNPTLFDIIREHLSRVTLRIQQDANGLMLQCYGATDEHMQVEWIDVPANGDVNLLWSREQQERSFS
jgi:hypothetical protein